MELQIVVDNDTMREDLVQEQGFCAYIVDGDVKVLLDTGANGNLINNAARMGIDLLNLDFIIFSHGHHDHTNGLAQLAQLYEAHNIPRNKRPVLIAHYDAFLKRYDGEMYIGCKLSYEETIKFFDVQIMNVSYPLTEKLVYLGEIPRINNFEAQKPLGLIKKTNIPESDFVLDDTALAYKSKDGLVVLSGCSHSGICNIIDYAKKVTGVQKIADVIGGLHLHKSPPELISATINSLSDKNVCSIHVCHCTGENAMKALENDSRIKQSRIGCGFKMIYE